MKNKDAATGTTMEVKEMVAEVKRRLKPESKNELIRIISALLLDNYTLKNQLDSVMQKIDEHNKKVDEINAQIAEKTANTAPVEQESKENENNQA